MERTPTKSGEEDNSNKKRPAIEAYFSNVVRPVESLRLIPNPETKPEVRRVVPIIPEAIVLFDRQGDSEAKDGKEPEKSADNESETEEDTKKSEEAEKEETTEATTGAKRFKAPFRPVIPRVPAVTPMPVAGPKSELKMPPSAETSESQKDHGTGLPNDAEAATVASTPEQPVTPSFEAQHGSLFDAFGELPAIEDYAEDDADAPAMPTVTQPPYAAPSPGAQAASPNQWPQYKYYVPNPNTPPPPGGATGRGAQPPVPPQPTAGMGGGGVPPLNPNMYPLASNGGGSGPNYNIVPAAANIPLAPTNEKRTAVDPLARLMGVGNWIGNRRTRKKLGNRIDRLQSNTNQDIAGLQSRQGQFEQKQRNQAQEIRNIQMQSAERPAAVAAPVTLASEMQPQQIAVSETHPQLAEVKQKSSTWLNMNVNKRGEVVNSTQEFGQGFHQERRQEVQRDRLGDSAAAGAVSLMGVQQDQHAPIRYDSSLPSGMTTPALPQGMPTHIDPQHQLTSDNKKTSSVPGPVFWIMLAIIVAAFFAAAFI